MSERPANRTASDDAKIEATNDAAEVHFECDPMGRIVRELTRLPDGTEHWVASRYGPDGHRIRVQSSDGHLRRAFNSPSRGGARAARVLGPEIEGRHEAAHGTARSGRLDLERGAGALVVRLPPPRVSWNAPELMP